MKDINVIMRKLRDIDPQEFLVAHSDPWLGAVVVRQYLIDIREGTCMITGEQKFAEDLVPPELKSRCLNATIYEDEQRWDYGHLEIFGEKYRILNFGEEIPELEV